MHVIFFHTKKNMQSCAKHVHLPFAKSTFPCNYSIYLNIAQKVPLPLICQDKIQADELFNDNTELY